MKKLAVFMLLICLFTSAALADVDLTYVTDMGDVFVVDIDEEGYVFINTMFDRVDFTHKYSLEQYPSYTYSDIIILDWFNNPYPVWRLWVSYSAENYVGLNSVSIEMDGTVYTFTEFGGTDRMKDYGTNKRESDCIIFGMDNLDFWLNFMVKCEDEEEIDIMNIFDWSFPMTLHGLEDIKTTFSGDAIADMYLIGEAMLNIAGTDYLIQEQGTPMKMS